MSLTSLLMKQQFHVPESILSVISTDDDRMLVENICAVVQSVVASADTSAAHITEFTDKYKVCIPLAGNAAITYTDMRTIFNYNVSRISDVTVQINDHARAKPSLPAMDRDAPENTTNDHKRSQHATTADHSAAHTGHPAHVTLTVHVNKHTARMPVSQLDIIRVTKKSRWF